MKKICIYVLLISLLCATLLCSCDFHWHNSLSRMDSYEAHAIVCIDIPFFRDCDADRFDKIRYTESDSYGRRLFVYETTSWYHREVMEVLLICQKTENGMAYYYEDFCYLLKLSKKGKAAFSDQEIAQLKKQNDWEQPFEESRTRCIEYPYNAELYDEEEEKLTAAVKKYLSLSLTGTGGGDCGKMYILYDDLDICPEDSPDGRRTVIVRVYGKQSCRLDSYMQSYIIVYHPAGDGTILACEPYEETLNCQEVIHDFKVRNGMIP